MAFTSNIDRVRKGLQAYKSGVAAAAARVLEPVPLRQRARAVAQAALRGVAQGAQASQVDPFLRRVFAEKRAPRVPALAVTAVSLTPPDAPVTALAADFAGTDLFMAVLGNNPEAAWDVIYDWVSSGAKERDGRDMRANGNPKTDMEIAAGIWQILFGSRTPGRDNAAASLLKQGDRNKPVAGFPGAFAPATGHPHLLDFAKQSESAGVHGLNMETMKAWLEVVRMAWRTVLFAELKVNLKDTVAASLRR